MRQTGADAHRSTLSAVGAESIKIAFKVGADVV